MGKLKKKKPRSPEELIKVLEAIQDEIEEHIGEKWSIQIDKIIYALKAAASGQDVEEDDLSDEVDEDDFV